eukprot:GHVL01018400.1.p1 GENE.GHVL01018400.1~~GHVL01018400.1.p1  ORF type:complete len:1023 (+),score=180.12 GHVL01018400.1:56-3124(+)
MWRNDIADRTKRIQNDRVAIEKLEKQIEVLQKRMVVPKKVTLSRSSDEVISNGRIVQSSEEVRRSRPVGASASCNSTMDSRDVTKDQWGNETLVNNHSATITRGDTRISIQLKKNDVSSASSSNNEQDVNVQKSVSSPKQEPCINDEDHITRQYSSVKQIGTKTESSPARFDPPNPPICFNNCVSHSMQQEPQHYFYKEQRQSPQNHLKQLTNQSATHNRHEPSLSQNMAGFKHSCSPECSPNSQQRDLTPHQDCHKSRGSPRNRFAEGSPISRRVEGSPISRRVEGSPISRTSPQQPETTFSKIPYSVEESTPQSHRTDHLIRTPSYQAESSSRQKPIQVSSSKHSSISDSSQNTELNPIYQQSLSYNQLSTRQGVVTLSPRQQNTQFSPTGQSVSHHKCQTPRNNFNSQQEATILHESSIQEQVLLPQNNLIACDNREVLSPRIFEMEKQSNLPDQSASSPEKQSLLFRDALSSLDRSILHQSEQTSQIAYHDRQSPIAEQSIFFTDPNIYFRTSPRRHDSSGYRSCQQSPARSYLDSSNQVIANMSSINSTYSGGLGAVNDEMEIIKKNLYQFLSQNSDIVKSRLDEFDEEIREQQRRIDEINKEHDDLARQIRVKAVLEAMQETKPLNLHLERLPESTLSIETQHIDATHEGTKDTPISPYESPSPIKTTSHSTPPRPQPEVIEVPIYQKLTQQEAEARMRRLHVSMKKNKDQRAAAVAAAKIAKLPMTRRSESLGSPPHSNIASITTSNPSVRISDFLEDVKRPGSCGSNDKNTRYADVSAAVAAAAAAADIASTAALNYQSGRGRILQDRLNQRVAKKEIIQHSSAEEKSLSVDGPSASIITKVAASSAIYYPCDFDEQEKGICRPNRKNANKNYQQKSEPEKISQPPSNRKVVRNALQYVCLAGMANQGIRDDVLLKMESDLSSFDSFVIVFKGVLGRQDFRALYAYKDGQYIKTLSLYNSPPVLQDKMVDVFFRYDTGAREFKELPLVRRLGTADAVSLCSQYLLKKKQPAHFD